jgi:hypothetical protein
VVTDARRARAAFALARAEALDDAGHVGVAGLLRQVAKDLLGLLDQVADVPRCRAPGCGRALAGRQTAWCSDPCRKRAARALDGCADTAAS